MDDKELVVLLKNNPEEGLKKALKKYGGLVALIVGKILFYYKEDADECVADTFISLWKNIDKVQEDASFKGYLVVIARNTAINRYNKLKRIKDSPIDDDFLLFYEAENNVEQEVFTTIRNQEIYALVEALGQPKKDIIIRRFFLFESVKEIAEKLNLTYNQTKHHIQYAKKLLKEIATKEEANQNEY